MTPTPERTSRASTPGETLDLAGVGFGPSNLALAIAIEEHNETCPPGERIRARFFERAGRFSWHPGMLLEGATMQVAFPKDLATFRNPRSRYSFLSYLYDRKRLVDFVNHQTFFPTRREFHDYLSWAAQSVEVPVSYSTAVQSVRRGIAASGVERFDVTTAGDDGGTDTVRARAVALGLGLQARLPGGVTPSRRCFHNHEFLFRVPELPRPVHRRFVVVGAGQSAAEVVQYLHREYPDAEVHNVFSRFGYSPADDSPYANRIFDPDTVDELYGAPQAERDRLHEVHRGTNYSVVDLDLINELYAAEYRDSVAGRRRLFMRRASTVEGLDESAGGVAVRVRSSLDGYTESLDCDAVVFATGFTPAPLEPLLGDLAPRVGTAPQVTRDYRLHTREHGPVGVYLQGGTETTHGLTSSLLSNVAARAGEIVESLAAAKNEMSTGRLAG